ncbi:hypothetical protein Krac_12098 [Ktedonobacter racemifer DSM 44963]|uniref:Uncharacterized protein n=1 Tax=Ktedonobacter racemifer DSM 44963 TaxID=485913 RepID=D6TF75_KTERA|nr:hypothetical protein Krac_12098 [Ktedonobacter racemifer DSM 44963]
MSKLIRDPKATLFVLLVICSLLAAGLVFFFTAYTGAGH